MKMMFGREAAEAANEIPLTIKANAAATKPRRIRETQGPHGGILSEAGFMKFRALRGQSISVLLRLLLLISLLGRLRHRLAGVLRFLRLHPRVVGFLTSAHVVIAFQCR